MIRVPVILAAAALVLPAAHYIDDALGTGARTLGASVALAAPGVATDKPRPRPPLHRVLHRDRVAVEEDGNGVLAARFATTFAGKDVRYALLVENGCASTGPARRCPAPVTGLTVTLNDDVVFQNDAAFSEARREITLNPAGTQLNSLVLAARGAPGSAARVRIIAVGLPDKPKPEPPLHRLVHRDRVAVEEDGNGVLAARFATTFAGKDVRYALLVENGCASTGPARRCPAPVTGLTVTLNDDVVFQNDAAFSEARREITLNPAGTQLNSLVLAARGAPGSAARVRIIAVGLPDKPKPEPPLHRLVHRDRVAVEEDGNGVLAARFATTFAGKDVRYALLVENGCASTGPARRCPAPVTGLTVTLNDDVVFQNDAAFAKARREITLNPAGTQLNSLVLAARGAPGSAARVRIIAIRVAPPDQA